MMKRVFSVIAGLLGFCSPLLAGQTDFGALNNSFVRLPSLMLSDAQYFSFATAFNRLETPTSDFLPPLSMATTTARPQRTNAPTWANQDSSKEVVDVRRNLLDYVHGEVGFLYGTSSGKFGGDFESTYVIGTVGDDRFSISAGAAYEHSSGRIPRFGR